MVMAVTMKKLLESGVHYGHQTRRWNPKMGKYIFGDRNGIHIIDLQQTVKYFQKACEFLEQVCAEGGHVLFVGTKRQARELVASESLRSHQFFMNYRWLGGTLTNFQTIRKSIHRLKTIEKMAKDGTFDQLTKKEALQWERERGKLEMVLGGIKNMPSLPSAIFVVDAHKEKIAIQEAKRLNIPVVAVADTNADPDDIDFIIPGNDDSIKSIDLFVKSVAEACLSGKQKAKNTPRKEKEHVEVAEGTFYDDTGHSIAVERKKRSSEELDS